MYEPIEENASWKVSSGTVADSWTSLSFDDSQWATVDLSNPTVETSGTQYFRKTFTGLANLAAYEVRFKFQYGIVAYLNGNEIFRDNMPAGAVTPTTPASGGYATANYYGVIRNGAEMNGAGILAVELHYTEAAPATAVSFNCWMMQYASSNPDTTAPKCFQTMPSQIPGDDDEQNAFDCDLSTIYAMLLVADPYIQYDYSNVRPVINGVAVYSNGIVAAIPTEYTVTGLTSTGSEYAPFIWGNNVQNEINTRAFRYSLFNTQYFRSARIVMTQSLMNRVQVPELSFYVCNLSPPDTMAYEQSAYEAVIGITSLVIKPTQEGFMGCSIAPALPEGLTLDASSCKVTGVITGEFTTATFTVTSVIPGARNYTASFTLTATSCAYSILMIKRQYAYQNPGNEAFSILDADTGDVVFSEPFDSTQGRSETRVTKMCIQPSRLRVLVSTKTSSWAINSFLYIGSVSEGNENILLRINCNGVLKLRNEYLVRIDYAVPAKSTWYYKMGSVPDNWYNSDMAGWEQSSMGSFPESTNRIQLYKKTFNVASLDTVSGIVMTIRTRYALIVYLNGVEAYRIGFSGALTPTKFTEQVYAELKYHMVTLPLRSVSTDSQESVSFINAGTNTIAIGLLAISDEHKTSTFDATVQFFGDEANSRVYDYEIAVQGMASSSEPFGNTERGGMNMDGCGANSLEVTFNSNRAEALTSFSVTNYYNRMTALPYGVVVKAKNQGEDNWTTLGTFEGWRWWNAPQEKKIYLANSKAYQIYRFENWNSGSSTDCAWRVNRLDLYVDRMSADIPDLAYDSLDGYLNVELAEIFPNSPYYTQFQVEPALPEGLALDQGTGAIMGTPTALTEARQYSITAKKITGESKTAVVTMAITICKGDHSLITWTMYTSSMPSLQFFTVYNGRGTTGTVVRDEPSLFMASNNYVYADFCLPHAIYTFETGIQQVDGGLPFPNGHSISVDIGTLRFDLGMIGDGLAPNKRTMSFSSFLPFQINYDDWRVYRSNTAVAEGWNTVDFDDSTWDLIKASEIGIVAPRTFYVRRTFEIPSEDYHVLNVHLKFSGGVAAYYNSRLVARFNLPDTFNGETFALGTHDPTVYSKFHVILATSGSKVGKNVIAFEVHREQQQSTATPVTFDATGVFGVETCSPVVDSQIIGNATELALGSYPDMFDLDPSSFVIMDNAQGTHVEWMVENLEGSRFNSYAFHNGAENLQMGWSLYSRYEEDEDWVVLHETPTIPVVDRERVAYDTPVAAAAFRRFRFVLDRDANVQPKISELLFQYCVASGNVCPAIDDYPSVQEGQISPSSCPAMYTGYSYRVCSNGVLGEVKSEHCVPKKPANLRYKESTYNFVLDVEGATTAPEYDNIIDEFFIDESVKLPEGLSLDPTTGIISGKPTKVTEIAMFTIYGKNSRSATQTAVSIGVRKGLCLADGVFQTTEVGTTAVYECSTDGKYVGTQKRECILGVKDGEWQKATGFCLSIVLLVVIIVVVVLVIVVVVYLLMRLTRKRKSVGGVKTAKKVKTTKVAPAKQKEVKV